MVFECHDNFEADIYIYIPELSTTSFSRYDGEGFFEREREIYWKSNFIWLRALGNLFLHGKLPGLAYM
jgi:hypothetical protein